MSELYLDEALFEELRSILDDEFPALITTYIQDSGVRVDDLHQAFVRGDADAVRKSAHSLKGASANLGLVYLAELCRVMEDAAREGVLEGQESRLIKIRHEQQHAVVLLRDRL
jgi:HPt (histidine-containing phosphotransfer) domain-containing protein